ncbi:hypothetical protein NPIL_47791 [Nephila pilipes]|uniref:Uncharacterized protein n=1 Tax=Nephila pilipes TaxID=299642 RepID=A0A8X6TVF9_NEPPI|nr:hypothetical protein NPIL_47791 [Nephila pilipes]
MPHNSEIPVPQPPSSLDNILSEESESELNYLARNLGISKDVAESLGSKTEGLKMKICYHLRPYFRGIGIKRKN